MSVFNLWWNQLTFAILFLLSLACGTGCNLFNQHAQMMDAMRGVMADTAARLGKEGQGQVAAGGQVICPGIRVSGGMEYYATATYEGVAGQITASMQGTLDRDVPPEIQEEIQKVWRNTAWTSEQKRGMVMKILQPWTEAAIQKYLTEPKTQPTETPGTTP